MSNVSNTTSRIPAISADVTMAEATSSLTMAHGQLVLRFADGTTAGLSTVDLNSTVLSMALMHGLKQKLVDAAAIARNTDTGASATLSDKKEAVLAVLDRLMSGQWNATREGSGDGGTGKGSILLLALMRAQPSVDAAALTERVKKLSDTERAALMKNPKILPHVQAIQAERAAAAAKKSGVDSDSLLSDLLG